MTEQDQIAKWRADFESFIVKEFEVKNPTAEKRRDSGEYFYAHVQLAWLAWCEAKRNMPVIEIPAYDIHHYAPVRNIIAQLEALSIQFKTKD